MTQTTALAPARVMSPALLRPWINIYQIPVVRAALAVTTTGLASLCSWAVRQEQERTLLRVVSVYGVATSPREVMMAAESLLSEKRIVRTMLMSANIRAIEEASGNTRTAEHVATGEKMLADNLPSHTSRKYELLGQANQVFAEWVRSSGELGQSEMKQMVAQLPSPWRRASLDDNRIPASIRLAVFSQIASALHVTAYLHELGSSQPSEELLGHITTALDSCLISALDLSLGLPGAQTVRARAVEEFGEHLRVLDFDTEYSRWKAHIRRATPLEDFRSDPAG